MITNTRNGGGPLEGVDDDELDLTELLNFVKARWWALLVSLVVGAACGTAASFLFKPVYRADAELIAADDFGVAQPSGGLAGLGGVASLVGISLPHDNQSEEALATLQSRALIESYINDKKLLPVLFERKWDSNKQAWRKSNPGRAPTAYDGYLIFKKSLLKVVQERKTGLIMVSVDWHDPALAQQWLQDLVARTNALLRAKAIERSNRNLAYLNEQADKTSIVELRSAIFKLIEAEIKKQMLAQGSEDYAFRYVDPPVVPEKEILPNRTTFLVTGALVAGTLAFLGLYFFSWRRQEVISDGL